MSNTTVPIKPTNRNVLYMLWAGILVAILGGIGLATLTPGDPVAGFLGKNRKAPGVVETASGLQYKVLKPGSGTVTPTNADVALINYEGKLLNGETFDKSQQPTPLSPKDVVPGFGEALRLMKKGASYRFWIKPTLGYGGPRPAGAPPLEGKQAELAKQILVFDVDLIDFLPETVLRQRMQQMQMQQLQGGAPQGGAPGAGGPPPGAAPNP